MKKFTYQKTSESLTVYRTKESLNVNLVFGMICIAISLVVSILTIGLILNNFNSYIVQIICFVVSIIGALIAASSFLKEYTFAKEWSFCINQNGISEETRKFKRTLSWENYSGIFVQKDFNVKKCKYSVVCFNKCAKEEIFRKNMYKILLGIRNREKILDKNIIYFTFIDEEQIKEFCQLCEKYIKLNIQINVQRKQSWRDKCFYRSEEFLYNKTKNNRKKIVKANSSHLDKHQRAAWKMAESFLKQ